MVLVLLRKNKIDNTYFVIQKLYYRKGRQFETEKEKFPLNMELMSSSDEDEDGTPVRRHRTFLTEEAKRHIAEVRKPPLYGK